MTAYGRKDLIDVSKLSLEDLEIRRIYHLLCIDVGQSGLTTCWSKTNELIRSGPLRSPRTVLGTMCASIRRSATNWPGCAYAPPHRVNGRMRKREEVEPSSTSLEEFYLLGKKSYPRLRGPLPPQSFKLSGGKRTVPLDYITPEPTPSVDLSLETTPSVTPKDIVTEDESSSSEDSDYSDDTCFQPRGRRQSVEDHNLGLLDELLASRELPSNSGGPSRYQQRFEEPPSDFDEDELYFYSGESDSDA